MDMAALHDHTTGLHGTYMAAGFRLRTATIHVFKYAQDRFLCQTGFITDTVTAYTGYSTFRIAAIRIMEADPRVAELPAYPSDGCISMVDDILVVKLG